MIILKTRSEVKVKVTVTRKCSATLRHPKMHPHTKFGIPTSKNIGDMHRTRSGTDTRTDGRTDSAITICLPKFLWGHKNLLGIPSVSNSFDPDLIRPDLCPNCLLRSISADGTSGQRIKQVMWKSLRFRSWEAIKTIVNVPKFQTIVTCQKGLDE